MRETAIPLIIAAIGAFLIPLLLRRTRIHHAVGEMLFGLILGHFSWFTEGDLLKIIAEIGFLFLLFTAGMEIEVKSWKRSDGAKLLLPSIAIVFSPFLLLIFLKVSPLFLLSAGATSVGIIYVFLREYDLSDKSIQSIMVIASYGEILTIIALILISESGEGVFYLIKAVGGIILIFIFAYIFFTSVRTFAWWFPERFKPLLSESEPAELGIRASFASVFILAGLCILLGVEPVIGAFLAGVIFSITFVEKEVLYRKINSITNGFFIPFFFIHIGSIMKIKAPPLNVLTAVFLFGLLSFITKIPAVISNRLNLKTKIQMLLLLATPISMIVAIFSVGLKTDALSPLEAEILFLYLFLSSLLNPIFARRLNPPF